MVRFKWRPKNEFSFRENSQVTKNTHTHTFAMEFIHMSVYMQINGRKRGKVL